MDEVKILNLNCHIIIIVTVKDVIIIIMRVTIVIILMVNYIPTMPITLFLSVSLPQFEGE